jgi:hypothetical protein
MKAQAFAALRIVQMTQLGHDYVFWVGLFFCSGQGLSHIWAKFCLVCLIKVFPIFKFLNILEIV